MPVIYELFINGKLTYCYKIQANCTYQFGRSNQPEKLLRQVVAAIFLGYSLYRLIYFSFLRFFFTKKPIA